MEIATLARAFPARVRVGVGHGVQDWMAQIGEKVESPMTFLREYLSCLTALLRGERVTFHGRYVNLEDVALDWPPDPGTEILAAAMGPRTLRLSGELATGTVITGGTTPDALRAALQHVRAGNALGTTSRPHDIVTYVLCSTGPTARQDIRAEIQNWGFNPDDDVAAYGDATRHRRRSHAVDGCGRDHRGPATLCRRGHRGVRDLRRPEVQPLLR